MKTASNRPKKQFESSNILELGYWAAGEGEGGGRATEHYARALRQTISNLLPTGLNFLFVFSGLIKCDERLCFGSLLRIFNKMT